MASKKLQISVKIKGKDELSGPLGRMAGRVAAFKARMSAAVRPTALMRSELGHFRSGLRMAVGPVRFMARGVTAVASGAQRMLSGISSLLKPVALLGVAAIGVAAGLVKLAFSHAEVLDRVGKLARIVGLSSEALQEWRFVAARSGLSADEFDKSIQVMTRNLGDARLGTGALFATLKKGSPQFLKTLLATKSNEHALQTLVQALHDLPDPAKRASLAQAAFGRSGLKMITISELTGEQIRELRGILIASGRATTEETDAAEKFIDAKEDMSRAVDGLKLAIGSGLLPKLQPLMEKLTKWVILNRELIASKVGSFFDGVASSLGRIDWASFGAGLEKALLFGLRVSSGLLEIMSGAIQGNFRIIKEAAGRIWSEIEPPLTLLVEKMRDKFKEFMGWLATDFAHAVQNSIVDTLDVFGMMKSGESLTPSLGGTPPRVPVPRRRARGSTAGLPRDIRGEKTRGLTPTGSVPPVQVASTITIHGLPAGMTASVDTNAKTAGGFRYGPTGHNQVAG